MAKRSEQEWGVWEDLCCPSCRSPLAKAGAMIVCSCCGSEFFYDNDIPDLRVGRFSYYFNPVPREQMRRMSEKLSRDNWSSSVREFIRGSPSAAWVDNVAVNGRYAWKFLMELPPGARVLDIGCGLGALVSNIAPHVERSYATDLTMERLIFADGRFRIFNAGDDVRTFASGDGAYIPFPDDSFDAVFLSGVLEWVGEGDTSGFAHGAKWNRVVRMVGSHFGDSNPRMIQSRFLKEIRRILRSDGELYIGIENRLSYTYFGLRRDHHSGLWFGSLMPRFLATLYSIGVKKRPYRTYTYSLRGYQRLLAGAGFSSVDFFGFNDGYSDLKSISPASADVRHWQYLRPKSWKQRIGRRPAFVPAFGILAKPGQQRQSRFLDRILDQVGERLNGEVRFSSFDISYHDKAVLRASVENRDIVVKLPMSRASEEHEQVNAEALRRVRDESSGVRGISPEPLIAGCHQNQYYFVEELVPGNPLADAGPGADLSGAIQSVAEQLRIGTSTESLASLDKALFDQHVQPRLELLGLVLERSNEREVVSEFFRSVLPGIEFVPGVMHGDLRLEHMLVDEDGHAGVVSWHAASDYGIPAVDAVSLVTEILQRKNPDHSLPQVLQDIAEGRWRGAADEELVTGLLGRCGQNSGDLFALVYLHWLFHITNEVPFRLQYDPEQIETLVAPVLDVFRAHLARVA